MRKDLTGIKKHHLTTIEFIGIDNNSTQRAVMWRCLCDCGNITIIRASAFGKTKSCGCIKTVHNEANKTKLWGVWATMKSRCHNKSSSSYSLYGGRGITVCDVWRNNYVAFREWALSSGYKEGLEIDRIDNNKDYSSNNCRFVTKQQNANNRRDTVFLTINGERKCLTDWFDDPRCEISYENLKNRHNRKWPINENILKKYTNPSAVGTYNAKLKIARFWGMI